MSDALRDERAGRLRAALREADIDLIVLAGNPWRSDYFRFALDVTPMEGPAVALIGVDGGVRLFVASPAEASRLAAEQPGYRVEWAREPARAAQDALGVFHAGSVALAPTSAAPWGLARGPLGASMAKATALLDRLILHKTPAEADAVERAVVMADEGYAAFRAASRIGRPEYEVVADTEAWMRSRGCPENFMIMASGGVEVRGMRPPSDRRLQAGDLVTTELTPCVDGYYAQICRTLVLGEPTTAQLDAYAVYVEALEAGIAQVCPGNTHADVARAQNDVFRRHGLAEYITSAYTRVRGHGVGLFPDGFHVLEDVDIVLQPDMTLIVHPNTYHPGAGYIVLGDTVRVTPGGCKVLTRTPRQLVS